MVVIALAVLSWMLSNPTTSRQVLSLFGLESGILEQAPLEPEPELQLLQPVDTWIEMPEPLPREQWVAPPQILYNSQNLPPGVMMLMRGVITLDERTSVRSFLEYLPEEGLRIAPNQPLDAGIVVRAEPESFEQSSPSLDLPLQFTTDTDGLVFTSETGYRFGIELIELFEPLEAEIEAYMNRPVEVQGVVRHFTLRNDQGDLLPRSVLSIRVLRVLE